MHGSIITDMQVFNDNYVPPTLIVRADEAREIIWRISNKVIKSGNLTDITMIYGQIGRVGIGKTTLAKYAAIKLSEELKEKGIRLRYAFVNAYGAPTLIDILSSIVGALGLRVPVRGASFVETMKSIADYLMVKDEYLLVILDEFQGILLSNKISPDDLYRLLRVYEEIPAGDGINRIGYILVANDVRALAYIREKIPQVESQIDFMLHLRAYSSYDLYKILEQRAELGLAPGSYSHYIIEMIADRYGEDRGGEGSARKAIKALQRAAERAEMRGDNSISEEDVRYALAQDSYAYIDIRMLKALDKHMLLVLYAVARATSERGGWIPTSLVRSEYEEVSSLFGEKPRKHTQFYEYISTLSRLGLLEKGVEKGKMGSIRLSPEIPTDVLLEVLDHILIDKLGEN
ncbi:MAG: AAA family ATPase [Desulfurococcales archaeon]|nr:AAA family ATPase [Desulfurococcales archaeon]